MKSLPTSLLCALATVAIPAWSMGAESISITVGSVETSKGFAIVANVGADMRLNLTSDTASITGTITLIEKSGAKNTVKVNKDVTFKPGGQPRKSVTLFAKNFPSDYVRAICDIDAWIEDTGRTGRTDSAYATLELPRPELVVCEDEGDVAIEHGAIRRVTYKRTGDNVWTVKANFRKIGYFSADPAGGFTARSTLTDRTGSSNDLEEVIKFLVHEFAEFRAS